MDVRELQEASGGRVGGGEAVVGSEPSEETAAAVVIGDEEEGLLRSIGCTGEILEEWGEVVMD